MPLLMPILQLEKSFYYPFRYFFAKIQVLSDIRGFLINNYKLAAL